MNKILKNKFSFFCKVALETIKRLFWQPDIIVCKDWQMSMLPVLLKKIYKNDEYYKNIKTVFFLHSIDENRVYSNESYKYIGLDGGSSEIETGFMEIVAAIPGCPEGL